MKNIVKKIRYCLVYKAKLEKKHNRNTLITVKWSKFFPLKENGILFIPTNWYYIQEVKDACIQYHIDADTYFTFIPNFFKWYKIMLLILIK